MQKRENKVKNKTEKHEEINKMLIENFANMQKALTSLAFKFDILSNNIGKLLQLFESAAKTFMMRQPSREIEKDREFLDKLNSLMEQNKTIARGLTLMEEKMREKLSQEAPQTDFQSSSQTLERLKRLPRF